MSLIRFFFRWMFRLFALGALFGAGLAIAGVALIAHSKTVQGIIGMIIVFSVVKWFLHHLWKDDPRTYCTPELLNGDPGAGMPPQPGPEPQWTNALEPVDELEAIPAIETVQAGGWDEPPAGYRGATAALNTQPSDDTIDIWFQGTMHAQVTKDEVRVLGDLAERDPDDPLSKAIAAMTDYAREILAGFTAGPYTDQDALAYAAVFLIPHEMLERPIPNPAATAEAFAVPVELLSPEIIEPLRKAIADREATTDNSLR